MFEQRIWHHGNSIQTILREVSKFLSKFFLISSEDNDLQDLFKSPNIKHPIGVNK